MNIIIVLFTGLKKYCLNKLSPVIDVGHSLYIAWNTLKSERKARRSTEL